jgi:hypothetical protein
MNTKDTYLGSHHNVERVGPLGRHYKSPKAPNYGGNLAQLQALHELPRGWQQEIFLKPHYTNAAPQHQLLDQGKQLWQGLKNCAGTHGFEALRRHRSIYSDEGERDSRSGGGHRLGIRRAQRRRPVEETEAGREAIEAGIPVIVPIEDTADLML